MRRRRRAFHETLESAHLRPDPGGWANGRAWKRKPKVEGRARFSVKSPAQLHELTKNFKVQRAQLDRQYLTCNLQLKQGGDSD